MPHNVASDLDLHYFASCSAIFQQNYTAAPLYRGPIDRGNRYNAVVLCRPLLIKKKFYTNNWSRIFSARYNADLLCRPFVTPKCPQKIKKRSQQITDRGEFGGSRTISRHRKRNRTAKNSVIVRPLKVNWAVCLNLINNVSKVITNNQCINSLSKVWTLITFAWLRKRYRIYTVQKPTQRKWLRKKRSK